MLNSHDYARLPDAAGSHEVSYHERSSRKGQAACPQPVVMSVLPWTLLSVALVALFGPKLDRFAKGSHFLACQPADRERKQQVLLVIDMQNDYDVAANTKLYGRISSPYVGDIASIVPSINKLRKGTKWDKVIFTQDWLNASLLHEAPFCIAGTRGADLLGSLDVDEGQDFFFSKNKDDAFNLAQAVGDAPRGYGLRNEGLRVGASSNALVDILGYWGFSSRNTSITIAGQMTDRCVLKSALHAREFGYTVNIARSAVYTTKFLADPEWQFPESPPSSLPVELLSQVIWSGAGGGNKTAFEYMVAAGASQVS